MAPKTTQELAEQIEALVAQYVAEGRRVAQQALERAFATASATAVTTSTPAPAKPKRRASGKRRSTEEIVSLGEQLYELIRARPGESMVAFAAEIGMSAEVLHRPMMRLKREGRVRSIGERQHTRYFPTAAGKPRASA